MREMQAHSAREQQRQQPELETSNEQNLNGVRSTEPKK